jgi:hypothetical protein
MIQQNPFQVGAGSSFSVAATQSTPSVEADWDNGILKMAGESYPENTYDIFADIIAWVEAYLCETESPLRLELHLNYLNTSSIRAMIDIFDRLQMACNAGRILEVAWLYDSRNPRSAELGEEFKEDYTFEFTIAAAPFTE